VELALILLDEQQHDEMMEAFQRTKRLLEKALKGTIDRMLSTRFPPIDQLTPFTENYRAFEAALPHHNFLLNSLNTAQAEVTTSRTSLVEVKESVGNKRADLVQLWTRGQQLEEMIKLMDQMCACSYFTIKCD
jgi:exocyst complex component 4